MIDILLISSSAERSTHIGAQLEQSGVAYRLRTLHGEARQLRAYAAAIKTADLLIVDDVDLSARELSGFEEVLAQAHLHCMLSYTRAVDQLADGGDAGRRASCVVMATG